VGNTGQIEGLPKNPRIIRDEKFAKLKKSIEDDPEMLELRELLVYPHGDRYVVIGGNMRLRAMIECGHREAPCKVLDKSTPVAKLRAYATKDNVPFGEFDWDALANEWDAAELSDWGLDLPKDPLPPDEDQEDYMPGFRLVVECTSEAQQQQYFKEITNLGIECKSLTL
jgi:ParB-like chromosome segregation protein Spo0J